MEPLTFNGLVTDVCDCMTVEGDLTDWYRITHAVEVRKVLRENHHEYGYDVLFGGMAGDYQWPELKKEEIAAVKQKLLDLGRI